MDVEAAAQQEKLGAERAIAEIVQEMLEEPQKWLEYHDPLMVFLNQHWKPTQA